MVSPCHECRPLDFSRTAPPATGPVTGLEELVEAWSLVYRNYRGSGLVPPNPFGLHASPSAMTPEAVVLVHRCGGEVGATVTAMGDTKRFGLPLDRIFPDVFARLRDRGRSLLEFGLFACDGEAVSDPSAVVDLLRTAFSYGVAMGHTDLMCGVKPGHARFYELMFGFHPVGPPTTYRSLNHAPVVLLRAEVRDVMGRRRRLRGLTALDEESVSPARFVPRFCFAGASARNSVIGRFLLSHGVPPGSACPGEVDASRPRRRTSCA